MFYVTLLTYIAALLVGTVATTIYFVETQRQREQTGRAILMVMNALLAYVFVSIVLGLLISKGYDHLYIWVAVVLCDFAYYTVIAAWIYLLLILTGKQNSRWVKPVWGMIVIYAIAVEVIVIVSETLSAVGVGEAALLNTLHYTVRGLNVLFMIMLLIVAMNLLISAIRHMDRSRQRIYCIILSALLLAEALFSGYQDQFLGAYNAGETTATLWIDPLLMLFLAVSVVMILRFRRTGIPDLSENKPDPQQVLADFAKECELTGRETELLNLVYEGYNNEEIADEMNISVNTVKHHLSHLLSKSGARNKHELLSIITKKL